MFVLLFLRYFRKLVERMYRDVRASAIPGGSEEVLLDFTIRQAVAKAGQISSRG